jgi:hypothetical protein
MDASHEALEEYGAKMIRGAGAPSFTGAQYKNTIYLNTTNNKLYYYSATDNSGTWQILETAVVQNSLADAKGDLIVASADNTWAKLGVGSLGTVLTVGASDTVEWSAPAVQTPAGTISATIATSAPSGWLLIQGQTVANADATYPSLWSVLPAAWKSGTSLVLPDWRGYYLAGHSTAPSTNFGTLGATVAGATTIATTHLPTHTHAIDHSHAAGTTGAGDVSHTHTMNHQHPTGTTTLQSSDHSHGMGHNHGASTGSTGSHSHYIQDGISQPSFAFVRRIGAYSSGFDTGPATSSGMAIDIAYTTAPAGDHSHPASVGNSTANNTAGINSSHDHSFTTPTHSGSTGSMSANATSHTHTFTTPSFAGTSGNGGFVNSAYVMPAGVINWMIKAH